MATAVSISSNALMELGASPISSFTENNDRARLAANLYPSNRRALIRSHTWNCCVQSVLLAPLVETPTDYTTAFLLPGDWIRTIRIGNFADSVIDFRQRGRKLYSDASSMLLRYVFDNDNEGTWDDLLVDVMTSRMKWRFCYAVTKSTSLRDTLAAEYRVLLQQAKSIDSMEEPGEQVAEESPLITIRG